jgi:hypothetical protein
VHGLKILMPRTAGDLTARRDAGPLPNRFDRLARADRAIASGSRRRRPASVVSD